MERIVSASPVQQVTSVVIDPQSAELGKVSSQVDLHWHGFKVNMEYYSIMTNRLMEENVQRLYMSEGEKAHLAMSLLNHLEPKILGHSGFLPISDQTLKGLAGETRFNLELVEELLEMLVQYNFFDVEFAKQDILTSMTLQKTVLRYGHKMPTAGVRIPLELLLVPSHERTKYCVGIDSQNHQLVRAYSKKKYGEISAPFGDADDMQTTIENLASRFSTSHYTKK